MGKAINRVSTLSGHTGPADARLPDVESGEHAMGFVPEGMGHTESLSFEREWDKWEAEPACQSLSHFLLRYDFVGSQVASLSGSMGHAQGNRAEIPRDREGVASRI